MKMDHVFSSVVFLLLIVTFVEISDADCPQPFSRYTRNHSYCKPKNPSCNILASGVTQQERNNILKLHNQFRSAVATQGSQSASLPTATDMLQMEWDDELAEVAQSYAFQCKYAHDCPNCKRVQNFGVGQNIAIQRITGRNLKMPETDWNFAVTDWFDEIAYFSPDLICDFRQPDGEEIGHFTQLAWARSFRVGCGYVAYRNQNTISRLYICNYGPTGNIYGSCVYNAGPTCSACPENTCCGSYCSGQYTYPGLCARYNNNAPVTPIKGPTLLYCDFHDTTIADCEFYIDGKKDFYTVSTLDGDFLETILSGGENTTLTFKKHIKPTADSFCVQLKYRKGPNVDGTKAGNRMIEVFTILSDDYSYTQQLTSYNQPARQQFSTFNLTLQWGDETEMKLSFAAPKGSPKQFFNVQSVLAVDGDC